MKARKIPVDYNIIVRGRKAEHRLQKYSTLSLGLEGVFGFSLLVMRLVFVSIPNLARRLQCALVLL